MTQETRLSVGELAPARVGSFARRLSLRWFRTSRWEPAVAALAVLAAVTAVWMTLRAGFLEYPGWLAVQKADFILGPIGVGLYWRYSRPNSRFGLLLIVLGLLGIPYILESSTDPTLFRLGVLAEDPIWIWTTVVILAFPTGRLGLPERLVVALNVVTAAVVAGVFWSHIGPGLPISGCRMACPWKPGAISYWNSWLVRNHAQAGAPVISLATAAVIAWRFATGTPPRRRALAIGAPIALLYLLAFTAYQGLFLFEPRGLPPSYRPVQDVLKWAWAVTPSVVWYGFLFALIAAELYAGRVLRRQVRQSLAHPSLQELEPLLRDPLGDPSLRLGFWRAELRDWASADGEPLEAPGPGQGLTEIERDGRPAAAIVHDRQLADDPELLQAAGAVALLALENAELESAWEASLRELSESRARIVQAGERERRKLERDLHDGAQQRLLAVLITLAGAEEKAADNAELKRLLTRAERETEKAIDELRELAHGIHPTVLADGGLTGGLHDLAMRFEGRVSITEATSRRFAPEIEAAVYYCCLEAVQNATKHAGPDVRVAIRLDADTDELRLEVRDNGPGFDPENVPEGSGLQNMRDRLGAVGGRAKIVSTPGRGTCVRGVVPAYPRETAAERF